MQPNLPGPFTSPKDKIIIALDNVKSIEDVKKLIEETSPHAGWFKVGLETITAFGSQTMVDFVQSCGAKCFYDAKFYDIPNTVGNASQKLNWSGVNMFDVHCSNGVVAMKKVVENKGSALVLGITVLTSFSEVECQHIFGDTIKNTVLKFAHDAVEAGLDGIVSSPKELEFLSQYQRLAGLYKITPGIQPAGMKRNDQQRVTTPADAIKLGASALVIGRAITESDNPGEAAKMIFEEVGEAMVIAK